MEYLSALFCGIFVYCLVIIVFGEKASKSEYIQKRLDKAKFNSNEDIPFENIPFMDRVIKPTIDSFIGFFSSMIPVNEKEQSDLTRQLLQAGIKIKPNDYIVMKLIIIILFATISAIYNKATSSFIGDSLLTAIAVGAVFGYLLLFYSLKNRIRTRQEKIMYQFPQFLDLLSVCVEAGLGFDQAIQYVTNEYPSELSEEFKIVIRDVSLGSTRKDALQKLQLRVTIDQLKTFTAAVIQADEMGISLKNILNAQAASVRQAHKQKVEEKAQKLPVKILIPMLLFIFPVIFIVLLVPAVLQVISSGVFE